MSSIAMNCPVCDAELVFGGDEEVGDEVFCSYCNAPFTLIQHDEEGIEVEEDF